MKNKRKVKTKSKLFKRQTLIKVQTKLLFVAMLLYFSVHVNASTYYVAPDSTGSECTFTNPGALNIGLNKLKAGDTLYLRGGTYHQILYSTASGSDENEIVISGYPGETAIIDGEYTIPEHWGKLVAIKGKYVIVQDIEITRSGSMGLVVSADHVTVRNVYSHHNYENGILFSGIGSNTNSAEYGIVENCDVSYNCWEYIQGNIHDESFGDGAGSWSSGITMQHGGSHGIIRNNKVYENGGEGISAYTYVEGYTSDSVTIENNIVYNNWSANIYFQNTRYSIANGNLVYNTKTGDEIVGGGIQIQNEVDFCHNDHNTITNNFIMNAKGGNIIRWYSPDDGGAFSNWTIANNTLVNAWGRACIYIEAGGGATGNRIYNNIFIQESSLAIAQVPSDYATWSHNCWSKAPMAAASGTGDIIADPKLAKTGPTGAGKLTAEWFKILSDSPARDKSEVIAEVTKDFFGTDRGQFPDIGGHEWENDVIEPITYILEVENGQGDGRYETGTLVQIIAEFPEPGYRFSNWAGNSSAIDDIYSDTATLTMPASNISISAAYKDIVVEEDVNLALNKPVVATGNTYVEYPASYAVDGNLGTVWSTDADGYPQTLEVDLGSVYPIDSTQLVCYANRAYQFKIEVKTSASSSYSLIADKINNTQGGTVANPITDRLTTPVLARFVKITITGCVQTTSYVSLTEFRVFGKEEPIEVITYNLTVNSGSNSGKYEARTVVTITANSPATNHVFDKWTGDVSHLANINNPTTTVTMPAADISVTATYRTVAPPEGDGWILTANFEDGNLKRNSGETDGFSTIGKSVYLETNKSRVRSGNYSARVHFVTNDRGWDNGLWHGAVIGGFPNNPGEGDEIWYRSYFYFPNSFSWLDQTPGGEGWRKIMRISVDGASRGGNVSIGGLQTGAENNCNLRASNETSGNYYNYMDAPTGRKFPFGEWTCLEEYVKFSSNHATAQHKIWINGELIWDLHINDRTNSKATMTSSTDHAFRAIIFTYWNDYPLVEQDAWVDDVILTTKRPSNLDAQGNYMIGPDNWVNHSYMNDNYQSSANEITQENQFKVFPNPATTSVTISNITDNTSKAFVSVYSVLGEKIFEAGDKVNLPYSIDMESYQSGTYIFKIYIDNVMFTKKVTKM